MPLFEPKLLPPSAPLRRDCSPPLVSSCSMTRNCRCSLSPTPPRPNTLNGCHIAHYLDRYEWTWISTESSHYYCSGTSESSSSKVKYCKSHGPSTAELEGVRECLSCVSQTMAETKPADVAVPNEQVREKREGARDSCVGAFVRGVRTGICCIFDYVMHDKPPRSCRRSWMRWMWSGNHSWMW